MVMEMVHKHYTYVCTSVMYMDDKVGVLHMVLNDEEELPPPSLV